MGNKAVLHFQKYTKSSGGSLGHHIDRTSGMEHSYRHADLNLTKNNIYVELNELCRTPYNEAIEKRISEGYQAKNKAGELKAIRKDAVHSCNVMLSGSPELMSEFRGDKKKLEQWVSKNLEFCKRELGENNIVRFAVHLDEKTPHIHCVFVPITDDGRLSVGDWIGTGKKLEDYQTRYAKEMESLGMERGEKSDRKHVTTQDWRRLEKYKISEHRELFEDLKNLKQSDLFSFNSKKQALEVKLETFIRNGDESTKKEFEALKTHVSSLERKISSTLREQNQIPKSYFLTQEQIGYICQSVSVKDYFFHLMERGKVDFEKKSGGEYYFRTETQKFSVNDKGYFDFKKAKGGQIIKAVMELEGMKWKEALDFLQKFSGTNYESQSSKIVEERKDLRDNSYNLTALMKPNNPALLEYYHKRGIEPQLLKDYTKQVHYQVRRDWEDHHFFGISIKNVSGGWELRSTQGKTKLGTSDLTELGNPNAKEIIVFEGMTDMLSFLQIQRDNKEVEDRYKLVCLNSVTNTHKFVERYQDFSGEIKLCLDADHEGQKATLQIQQFFNHAQDIREHYGIYEGKEGAKDLNQALMRSKGLEPEMQQKKNRDLGR